MSYRLMLDFYGLQLQDECTGALQRSPVRVGSISLSPRALTPPTRPTQCFRERMQAAIVRSSHAHARIGAIDASAALALPGVAAVLTGEDVRELSAPFLVVIKQPMRSIFRNW